MLLTKDQPHKQVIGPKIKDNKYQVQIIKYASQIRIELVSPQ